MFLNIDKSLFWVVSGPSISTIFVDLNDRLWPKADITNVGLPTRKKAPGFGEISVFGSPAAQTGISDREALASLADGPAADQAGLTFNAVSLDEKGRAIPILNSDDGFAMLFGNLSAADLERSTTALLRPFPAGLLTPVGLVVANPVFASNELRQLFTNNHYHGTVVWSWQQALLAAGLERQLQRTDLPAATRQQLSDAQTRLWQVISSTNTVKNSELWSWSFAQEDYRIEPFGQRSGDQTESNAAQLWSTVYLAISAP